MDKNANDKEFEALLNTHFPNDDSNEDDDLVNRFDREMKKTLAETAAKLETEKLQPKEDFSPETFWKNECEKALCQLKKKDIQIIDLEKEKTQYYEKLTNHNQIGAVAVFMSCVLGLLMPFSAIGIVQVKNLFDVVQSPLMILGFGLALMVLGGGIVFWFFMPISSMLVNGLNLDRAYGNGKRLKIFLAALVCVILISLLIIIV